MKFNKVIFLLTASDVFTWAILSVLNAFVGLYLSTKFGVGALGIVGIGTAVFSLTRGVSQIPFGLLTDRIKSDKDDIWVLFIGNILIGGPFLLYPYIESPIVFYILQIFSGLGAGMNLVTWRKMFAKNLDKGMEGMEYGIYDTVMSIFIALFGVMAGVISELGQDYFDGVMVVLGFVILSSGVWPMLLFRVKDRKSIE